MVRRAGKPTSTGQNIPFIVDALDEISETMACSYA
jgi:hypothetical protein